MADVPLDEPVDLTVARLVATRCVEFLEPDADLRECGWDEWEVEFERWLDHGLRCTCNLDTLRYGLEDVRGTTPRGRTTLAALKLALSTFILERENPYTSMKSIEIGSDQDLLIRRSLDTLVEARSQDGRPEIVFDWEVQNKVAYEQEQDWLRGLIDNAVTVDS